MTTYTPLGTNEKDSPDNDETSDFDTSAVYLMLIERIL